MAIGDGTVLCVELTVVRRKVEEQLAISKKWWPAILRLCAEHQSSQGLGCLHESLIESLVPPSEGTAEIAELRAKARRQAEALTLRGG